MSSHVDERIVQMQFDNAQFEERARNTISILGSLSEALNLPNGGKGLQEIQNAARQINFDRLNSAIEAINFRFSALGSVALKVFDRITDAAINTGQNLVKAITIDPVKSGFSEYEEKMDSVKRILNSAKGANGLPVTLDTVNKKLDELNTYSDKTIYSFRDMTTNIGKFTNAGVNLDDSVAAIQGIANEAALSGANAQEASRAMYNFAQALSAGYVKLIDWKSIENANMATVGFKEQLIQTAYELGTLRKEGDKYISTTKNMNGKVSEAFNATQGFNDALGHQWMTSEVLTKTLAKYADETTEIGKAAFKAATEVMTFSKLIDTLKEAMGSGWAQTWQIIIGDYGEAKELWTGINDVLSDLINSSAASRNKLLSDWEVLGGRKAVLDGLKEAWGGITNVVRDATWAFQRVFTAIDGFDLVNISLGIREFGKSFRQFTAKEGPYFSKTVQGIASVLDIFRQIISAIARSVSESLAPAVGPVGDLIHSLFQGSAAIGDWLTNLANTTRESDFFYNAIQKVLDVFRGIPDAIQNARNKLYDFLGIQREFTNDRSITAKLTGMTKKDGKWVPVDEKDLSLLGRAVGVFKSLGSALQNFISSVRNSEGFKALAEGFGALFEALGNFARNIGTNLAAVLNNVGVALGNFFKGFKDAKPGEMLNVFNAGLFGAIALGISKLSKSLAGKSPLQAIVGFFKSIGNFHKLVKDAGEAMTEFFGALTGPLKELTASLKADVLIKIAVAIAVLAGSAIALSMVDAEKLSAALLAIGGLMTELATFMTALGKFTTAGETSHLSGLGKTMVAFSIAVGVVALAVRALANLEPDKLRNGVIAIGILMTIMVLLTKLGGQKINSKGMISMSIAILILQNAVRALSEVDPDKLVNGVLAVGILMAMMTVMSKLGGKKFSGAGMIAVAIAITIMKGAIQEFASMDLKSLAKGVGAVGALILVLTVFSKFAGRGAIGLSVSVIAIAASMRIFAEVIGRIGNMPIEKIGKGLLGIGGALAAVAIAMNLMPKGSILKAVSFKVIADSLGAIVDVISALSGFKIEDLGKALLALGIALAEVSVATNAMKIGGAIALRGMAGGLTMFIPVLQTLGSMPFTTILQGLAALALTFTLLYAAGIGLKPVVPVLLSLAGTMTLFGLAATLFGAGLLAAGVGIAVFSAAFIARSAALVAAFGITIRGIIGFVPMIVASIGQGIVTIISVIGNAAPVIVDTIVKVASAILDGIQVLFPKVAVFLTELLIFVINTLAKYAPILTNALVELIIQLVDGVAAAIYDNSDRIIAAVHHLLLAILDLILAVLQEILRGIPGIGGKIDEAIGGIRESLKTDFDENYAKKLGSDFTQGIADGVSEGTGTAESAGASVGEATKSSFLEALAGTNPEVGSIFNGDIPSSILSGAGESESAATEVGDLIKGSLGDSLTGLDETGLNVDQGLTNGILDNMGIATDAGSVLGEDITQAINDAAGVSSPSTKTWETGMYLDQGLANGLTENQSVIGTAVTGLGDFVMGLFNGVSGFFASSGAQSAAAYGSGIRSGAGSAVASASAVSISAANATRKTGAFSQNGTAAIFSYSAAMGAQTGRARTTASAVGAAAVSGVDISRPRFSASGNSSGLLYSRGISSKTREARAAGHSIGTSAANGAKSVTGFYQEGRDSSQGYINGLMSKAREMARAAAQIVKDALNAAKNAIDSHSPSRAYMQLGEDSDEGYILGAKRKAKEVNAAMSKIATNAMGVFYEGISRANTLANDDLMVTPTVTPVMDASRFYSDFNYLTGAFANTGGILGSISTDINDKSTDIEALVANTNDILRTLKKARPITIDGKTVIGWVDRGLGALG